MRFLADPNDAEYAGTLRGTVSIYRAARFPDDCLADEACNKADAQFNIFPLNLIDFPIPLGWQLSPISARLIGLHSGQADKANTALAGSAIDEKPDLRIFGYVNQANDFPPARWRSFYLDYASMIVAPHSDGPVNAALHLQQRLCDMRLRIRAKTYIASMLAMFAATSNASATECGGPRALRCGSDEWCSYSPPTSVVHTRKRERARNDRRSAPRSSCRSAAAMAEPTRTSARHMRREQVLPLPERARRASSRAVECLWPAQRVDGES